MFYKNSIYKVLKIYILKLFKIYNLIFIDI